MSRPQGMEVEAVKSFVDEEGDELELSIKDGFLIICIRGDSVLLDFNKATEARDWLSEQLARKLT